MIPPPASELSRNPARENSVPIPVPFRPSPSGTPIQFYSGPPSVAPHVYSSPTRPPSSNSNPRGNRDSSYPNNANPVRPRIGRPALDLGTLIADMSPITSTDGLPTSIPTLMTVDNAGNGAHAGPSLHRTPSTSSMRSQSSYGSYDPTTYADPALFVNNVMGLSSDSNPAASVARPKSGASKHGRTASSDISYGTDRRTRQ